MTTKEVLALNYYEDGNAQIIKNRLKGIKPFQKYLENNEDVPMELMEKYIGLIQRKYALQLDYISPTFVPNENNLYSATVRRTDTGKYLTYIYSTTLYELVCKVCILYHAVTNGKSFPLADWKGQADKRAKTIKTIYEGKTNGNE